MLAVLLGGKNLERKALVSPSQVVMGPDEKEISHALALSLRDDENKCRWIASLDAL